MIIARSPLRITLGGGGTDLPSYYERHGGSLVSAAIDKYVYVAVTRTFLSYMLIRYSKIEKVQSVDEIRHPIIREALTLFGIEERNLEVTTMADIPAGTGLGSSGSFTTALLKALFKYRRSHSEPQQLAKLACEIEIDRLGEPVGKQDQYIAAFGGLTCFDFCTDGTVEAAPLQLSDSTVADLDDHLLLFSTGLTRSASEILKDQDDKTRIGTGAMLESLHEVKRLGAASRAALESGDLAEFGRLMHYHWEMKRKRSESISSPQIDAWYDCGLNAGALGGKVIGAGGGGFLMFYTPDPPRLRAAMAKEGREELRFGFDYEGTKVL